MAILLLKKVVHITCQVYFNVHDVERYIQYTKGHVNKSTKYHNIVYMYRMCFVSYGEAKIFWFKILK